MLFANGRIFALGQWRRHGGGTVSKPLVTAYFRVVVVVVLVIVVVLATLLDQSHEESAFQEELAEDRFHRDDALSMHYIQQREGDRKEKWDRHEKEKKEREKEEKDDNVEHIDVEDFQPGGKYGPPAVDIAAKRDEVAGVSYTEVRCLSLVSCVPRVKCAWPPPPGHPPGHACTCVSSLAHAHPRTRFTRFGATLVHSSPCVVLPSCLCFSPDPPDP